MGLIVGMLLASNVAFLTMNPIDLAANFALLSGLLVLALIDIRIGRLPNALTAALGFAGLTIGYFVEDRLLESVVGAVVGYFSLWFLDVIYVRIRGRHGLGGGDAKLLAAGGAWLGWEALPEVVLIASLVGIITFAFLAWRGQKLNLTSSLPFGPALAVGIWCARLSQHFLM